MLAELPLRLDRLIAVGTIQESACQQGAINEGTSAEFAEFAIV